MKFISIIFITIFFNIKVSAQYVEYTQLHEDYIMQQFNVMETGAGALTPRWYYNTFHKNYANSANIINKDLLRNRNKAKIQKEQILADTIKSDLSKRAKIETLNYADRLPGATDLAWITEKNKIERKMQIFIRNINKIVPYGGSAKDQQSWELVYDCLQQSINIIRESYLETGKRKKEYLAIYNEIVKRNVALTKNLMAWSCASDIQQINHSKTNISLLSSKITLANDALSRWRSSLAVDGFSGKTRNTVK